MKKKKRKVWKIDKGLFYFILSYLIPLQEAQPDMKRWIALERGDP